MRPVLPVRGRLGPLMELAEAKRLVRRGALARRRRMTEAEREAAGAAVAVRVLALDEVAAAGVVLAYAATGAEVPTDGLIERLLASGVRVLLPAVDGDRIRAREISSLADVAPGYRGIREPLPRPAAVAPAADVILVPGVAFDATGRRLGYGGGFYDRYLAAARGFRAGLCYEAQVVEEVPAGPDDEPVDIVVTEARTLRVAGSRNDAPGGRR